VSEIVAFDPQCGKTGSRQQLPLVLGWAMMIHKSQGLILNHVVLGIRNKELVFGMTYIRCSHLKSYKGFAFQMSFPWERMEKINRAKGMRAVRVEIARLNGLIY
jgi:hypothetical protein